MIDTVAIKKYGFGLFVVLCFVMVLVGAKYFLFDTRFYFQQQIEVYLNNQIPLYVHIIGGMLAAAIGPFQLMTNFRNKNLKLHKYLGRIYATGVGVAGITGLYLSTLSYGGMPTHVGFFLLSLLWLFTLYMAIKTIRQKQVMQHRRWMIRNMAFTFAAVTLRIYLGLFIVMGYSFLTSYTIATWLSWVGNLFIVELYLSRSNYKITSKEASIAKTNSPISASILNR